jgi:uncharacterized protein YjhX (UPF0386 family)
MIHEKNSAVSFRVKIPVIVICVALILALAPSVPHTDGAASATGFTADNPPAADTADTAAESARARVTEEAGDIFGAPSDGDASGGDASALATGLGPPAVDAVISDLPYSDSQTIDGNTHKVTISAIGVNETLAYRGYVYKINLTKGASYSISMIFSPAESFYCLRAFVDGDSNMIEDVDMTSDVFTASKSGTFYMLITDMGVTEGGRYTLRIEKASSITGKVMNSKGKALPGVTVAYYNAKKSRNIGDLMGATWTDYQGRYSIAVKPGSYKILFLPDGSAYNRPRYTAEYYRNGHSIRKARVINVAIGKTRSGVNARLAAYRAPRADRKIASLPFKQSSSVNAASREVQVASDGFLYRAKVYSVRLREGRGYEFALKGGRGSSNPMIWMVDSKGYFVGGFSAESGDKKTATGAMTPNKTGNYRVFVLDPNALSSFRYTLNISDAFTPGRITGQVVNRGGHALANCDVAVYKKRGKRWVSYLWDSTGINGKYSVDGLAPGEYKVKFSFTDDEGSYTKYYKKGSPGGAKKRSGGTVIKIRAGGSTGGIDMRY